MTLVRPLVVAALGVVLPASFAPLMLAAQPTAAFTRAQADQGATIFTAQCAVCHGAKLEGNVGPPLAGSDFMTKWTGQTADDLHYIVATQMPQTSPGSLKPAEALAVVAYILQQNKYVAGDTPLSAATLKSVKIAPQ